MRSLASLYRICAKKGITVLNFPLKETTSVSLAGDDGQCYIGIDYSGLESESEERVHLAHEVGHCVTGAFYNRHSTFDLIAKHENRADKWAIKKLLPFDEMKAAMQKGYTNPWELAEYFGVTEVFIQKAFAYYSEALGLDFKDT